MIVSDTISALCMAVLIVLFLVESVELWHIYTMRFVRSAMQAFQTPAATTSTVMLMPQDFIPRAAGLNQSLQGVMLVAAAPLGALALAAMPIGYALAIVAAPIGLAVASPFGELIVIHWLFAVAQSVIALLRKLRAPACVAT